MGDTAGHRDAPDRFAYNVAPSAREPGVAAIVLVVDGPGDTDAASRARPEDKARSAAQASNVLRSVSVSGSRVTVVVSASVNPWFPLISGRTVSKTATATTLPIEVRPIMHQH